jgi:hemolysin activation/secretion protein
MMHGGSFAAEALITPGSVLDTLGTNQPRRPVTPPQVVMPVQAAPSVHEPRAKRFRVNAFEFSGNTVYKRRLLKRLLERFVDMELNLYDLNKAADAITTFYHDRGYTLARAVIPAQKVVDGVVNIQIIEGRIGKVSLSGNKRFSSSFIKARTDLVKPGSLVTTDRLETTLLLLNDIPGLNAKVILAPGAEFGDSDAEINLTEKLFSGSIGLNNYGRKETGQNKLELALNVNSLFGWGDQLALSGSSTDHTLVRYWKAGYSIPLNNVGTRLSIGTSKVEYEVSGALSVLGITGDVDTTEMAITHPFMRTRNNTQVASIGFRRDQLTQTALDTVISKSDLSVMTIGYQLSYIHDDAAVTNASFGFTTNFKGVHKIADQDAVLARWEMDINHTAALSQKWDLYLRTNIVHSNQMLPDTEKFSLGGPSSVRGYRPSELRGDTGYIGTVELRRPFAIAGTMGIFRLTADSGEVTYKAPGYRDNSDRLHSVGFGVALYPGKGITASIDAARPIGSKPATTDGKANRIWMSVSANF